MGHSGVDPCGGTRETIATINNLKQLVRTLSLFEQLRPCSLPPSNCIRIEGWRGCALISSDHRDLIIEKHSYGKM